MSEIINEALYSLGQLLVLILVAPLIAGIIKKIKAFMQNRIGSSIFQEYYDLLKWWNKPTVITPYTSNIFLMAPFIYLLSVMLAALMLPRFFSTTSFGDVFVFISILAIGRFFMTLASLDSATAFGGMGGSRELYISALVEPVMLLAVLSVAIHQGSTSINGMVLPLDAHYFTVSGVLTCFAFFAVLLAENGRIPVDNPDTHLELTMIHECMTLEYSGRLMAVIHLASMLKAVVFMLIFSFIYFPISLSVATKVLITAVAVAVVEGLNNKMRLFKVRFYMLGAGILLLLAIVAL